MTFKSTACNKYHECVLVKYNPLYQDNVGYSTSINERYHINCFRICPSVIGFVDSLFQGTQANSPGICLIL